MINCGKPRFGSSGTWVTDDMIDAYCRLASYGITRSVEVWNGDTLAGGLYGVALGRVFIGESMFSAERDASKVALAHIVSCGKYLLIDCQLETTHLLSLGAESISRKRYLKHLRKHGDLARELLGVSDAVQRGENVIYLPHDEQSANQLNRDRRSGKQRDDGEQSA